MGIGLAARLRAKAMPCFKQYPLMFRKKRLSGARFGICCYAFVHALGHLGSVGCHHAEEDPGYFGEFIARFDFAQPVVVLVIAIAAFQHSCPCRADGFAGLIFLLAQCMHPAQPILPGCPLCRSLPVKR